MGAVKMCDVATEAPMRVLVVDDEVLIRLLIAEALRQDGCEVLEASTADEALDLLHVVEAPDVIVTDIRMPGRASGLDLAAQAHHDNPRMKVLVTSAYLPTDCARGVADACLAKPFALREVVERVHALAPRQ
jgi:CheY-like chemotaxis protein